MDFLIGTTFGAGMTLALLGIPVWAAAAYAGDRRPPPRGMAATAALMVGSGFAFVVLSIAARLFA